MCCDYLTVNTNTKFGEGRKDKVLPSQIAYSLLCLARWQHRDPPVPGPEIQDS